MTITLKDIKDRINDRKKFSENELIKAILNEGIENVHFIIPVKKVDDSFEFIRIDNLRNTKNCECWVECYISEGIYKTQNNYAITLRSVNPIFGYEHYYISDLCALISNEIIIIKLNIYPGFGAAAGQNS